MRILVLLAPLVAMLAATAAADPRPPLDPDDVYPADRGLVCWEVPRANGCNLYGCWTDGGGCNLYGCWNGPAGSCTQYGCSDSGTCGLYGCPPAQPARPLIACSREDEVAVLDSGCNQYGCWRNGGGCNLYGCWQSAYGSCNQYGCAEVGTCTLNGCPHPPHRLALHRGRHACQ